MEILGVDERDDSVFVKLKKDEFAKLAGFANVYSMEKPNANIRVGNNYNVGAIYTEAVEALEAHKKAVKAAQQLKASSTRFLAFFKASEDKQ